MSKTMSKFKGFWEAPGACRPGLAWGRKAGKVCSNRVCKFLLLELMWCATLAEIGDAAITVLSKIGIEKVKQLYCKTGDKIRQISCQNL